MGTGIFLVQKDQKYSEVVIKSKSQDVTVNDEIPEEHEGVTSLKDIKEKTVITYWTKYISKKKCKTTGKRTVNNSRKVPCSSTVVASVSDDDESLNGGGERKKN